MRALLTIGAMIGIVAWTNTWKFEGNPNAQNAIIGLIVVGYFLPTFVAFGRRHPGTLMVFVLNLFLGWTFIGWVSALVQACVPIYSSIPISVVNQKNTGGIAG